MSAGQGTRRTVAAAAVAVATLAAGIGSAGADGSDEEVDQTSEAPLYEVIVSEETAPGEAPVFEVVETDLDGLVDLLVDPSVGAVELNGSAQLTLLPSDPDYPVQWEHINTGLELAWDTTLGDEEIVIAVLDSGVAPSDDLGSRLLPGVSFVDGDPHVDSLGHGSSVAAVAAAGHNMTAGAGVCPQCTILPVQVATPQGAVPWSAASEGIVWAVDQGADIINMSFSGPGLSMVMADAVAYAQAADVVVVASAGNYGTTATAYPAGIDGVISVGAHDPTFDRYAWSSHGPSVDVAAPGCTLGAGGVAGGVVCGTSFAAPWTAGVLGLLLATDAGLSNAIVEWRLESATTALDWVETGRIEGGTVLTVPAGPPPGPGFGGFSDVPGGAFYADAVAWMVDQEITTGTAPGVFSPDIAVTRGQLAAFLWRLEGRPEAAGGAGFGDVPGGAFFAEPVAWMVEQGITSGTAPGVFSPEMAVTRGQLAAFLWRLEGRPEGAGVAGFGDVPGGAFYAQAVAWMVEQGITSGTALGVFSPDTVVTRGQLAAFLWRLEGQPTV